MTSASGITAIVLAGGRSRRFGGPKLALEIEGRPLLDHAVSAVTGIAGDVIIAGAPTTDGPRGEDGGAGGTPIRTVPDTAAFEGPLAGLANALRATNTALAIVVGGDMPGLVPAVLRAMLDRLVTGEGVDAVILGGPAAAERRQVLPLAINVAQATAATADTLAAGDRSLVRLLERLRVVEIPAAEWLALDPGGRTLLDVDRPEDVARIRRQLR